MLLSLLSFVQLLTEYLSYLLLDVEGLGFDVLLPGESEIRPFPTMLLVEFPTDFDIGSIVRHVGAREVGLVDGRDHFEL